MLSGAGALAALMLAAAPRPAAACLTCTWQGWCDSAPSGGSSCTILYHDGRSWCGHSGDCHTQITMTPLEVSPTGTYLAAGGPQVEEDRVRKQECNGFVTGHAAGDGARASGDVALRI
jgi:hypothetical protein